MPLGSPPLGSFGEDEDEEPDGGSPHRIYDKVEDDPESPYEYVIHCNFNKLIGTACSIGVGLWQHRCFDIVTSSALRKLDNNIYDDPFNGEEGVYDRVEEPCEYPPQIRNPETV